MHISERPRPEAAPSSEDSQSLLDLAIPPRQARRRGLVWLALGVSVIAAGAFAASKLLALPTVTVSTIAPKAAERVLAVTGRIRAQENVQVVPRIAGQIRALNRREGDLVTAGEVLGVIEIGRAHV